MSIDDEKLMAFADGELSDAERADIEAELTRDAALRERLAAHQALRTRLSAAFDGALSEPPPARLAGPASGAEVIDLSARRAPKWSVREWGAMAASIAAGLVIGIGLVGPGRSMIIATDRGVMARGELARALDTQLASDPANAVRIGLSFRNREGGYCRTFNLTRSNAAGLACHSGEGWTVAMTVAGEGGGEVRQAGASPELLASVESRIAGDPLDSDAERAARAAHWR